MSRFCFQTYGTRTGARWNVQRQDSKPPLEWTINFKDDGTHEGKWPIAVVRGTYKLEGRNLSITVTELNGKPTQGREAEPTVATLSEDGKSFSVDDVDGTGKYEYIKQE